MKINTSLNVSKLSRIVLIAGAVIYFAFGIMFFISPDMITVMDGIILPDRAAANHIRAVYGGMEIGLALLLINFCIVKDGLKSGLIVLAFSIGFTSISRLYGIVFDQGGDISNILSFIAEFSFAVVSMLLFRAINKNSQQHKMAYQSANSD